MNLEKILEAKRSFEKLYSSFPEEYRLIHHCAVKELPYNNCKPLSPQLISSKLNLPIDNVITALNCLEKSMAFLYRNEQGEVVWAYPFTVVKTPHRITISSGETLYAA
ncbi:MAG: hypothetical protein GY756_06000 [bacterium]|nr:hypothetical protein [bacterium]